MQSTSVFYPALTLYALPLAGFIPPELGTLGMLKKLHLSDNELTGNFLLWGLKMIPWMIPCSALVSGTYALQRQASEVSTAVVPRGSSVSWLMFSERSCGEWLVLIKCWFLQRLDYVCLFFAVLFRNCTQGADEPQKHAKT